MNRVALAFSRAASVAEAQALEPARWARDTRFMRTAGAMICVLLVLMIVPEGFNYSDLSSANAPAAGGPISRLLWLTLLGSGSLVILWRAQLSAQLLRSLNPFLLLFALLAVASVAWSIAPSVTARRLIRLATIVIDSVAFVLIAWHALRFQNVVRPVLTAVLVASLIFGIVWPTLAIHQEATGVLAGAWHGLANHKNGFGDIACIALIFWFHSWLARETRGNVALIGGGIAVACLFLSRSTTSMVAAIFTLLFLTMLLRSPRSLRPYMPFLVTLFIAALLVYSVALLNFVPGLDAILTPVSALTGKDLTFTGRTEIWAILGEHIRANPLLGTGYGAYWTGPMQGGPSFVFIQRMNFYPGSAHNGYLEVLNDLGALGMVLLFGYLVTFAVQALRLHRGARVQAALFLAIFLQQAITNLSESHWFSPLSVDFVILTLTTTALARTLLEQRLVRQFGAAPAHDTRR